MNKVEQRKVIEQISDLVKTFKREKYNDEEYFLEKIKDEVNKFKIKYDFLDKYGVDIKKDNIFNEENIKIDERYAKISIYKIRGDETSRILNSDKQPNNELLMVYSHSTGSYMFGGGGWSSDNYYDPELFDMYFEELKKYKYKYIDDLNHYIYFDLEEGFKLYKDYKNICDKYQKLFDERRNNAKVEKLQEELKRLKKENE